MNSKKLKILLIILVVFLFVLNYSWLNRATENFLDSGKYVRIDRVIDGDTVQVNGTSIRLLGINTPEHGERYFQEAKDFMENQVLNKTVRLEFGKEKQDRYGRTLAYIFLNGENINLKVVEMGLGNFYFPSGKDKYYDKFSSAWNSCANLASENLCKKSDDICSKCIVLENFNSKDEIITLRNICNFSCDLTNWDIKDEGRKHFDFPSFVLNGGNEINILTGNGSDSKDTFYWKNQDYVWTETGDTLFLRDSENGLVLWKSY